MKSSPFKGTGVALITPFQSNNSAIDFHQLEAMIEHTIQGGVDYIVSLGTTGESTTLSDEECQAILHFTVQKVQKRVPLVAGCFGHNNTQALTQRFDTFDLSGFDAILSSSPAYNKPSQEGIFQHYMQLAAASPLPIIIYNVPGRTASNIAPTTVVRLAQASSKFIGIKEASGDINQGTTIIRETPKNFLVLSGDDPTALALTACGGDGVISVIANAYPQAWTTLINKAIEGDLQQAQHINNLLWDIHPLLYTEGNPVGIKAACHIMGLCEMTVRLPLVAFSKDNYDRLKQKMKWVQAQVLVK